MSLVFAYPRRAVDGSFAGVVFVSFRDTEFAKLRLAGTKSDSSFSYFDREGALIATDPLDSDRPESQPDAASMRLASQYPGVAVPSFVESADGTVYIGALAAVPGPAGTVNCYVRSTLAEAVPLHAWRMSGLRRAGAAFLMLISGLALCGIFLRRRLVRDLLQTVAFTRMAVAQPVGDVPITARTAEMHAAMGSVVETQCAWVSTPSATTLKPRSCARSMVERTMRAAFSFCSMSFTKDLSILVQSTGSRDRCLSDE